MDDADNKRSRSCINFSNPYLNFPRTAGIISITELATRWLGDVILLYTYKFVSKVDMCWANVNTVTVTTEWNKKGTIKHVAC
jgi:hypothetical protein